METNLKFDAKKCLDYINAIEDFTMDFGSRPSYDESTGITMYAGEHIAMKSFLIELSLRCKKESQQEEHDFLNFLRQYRQHRKLQQYTIVGNLNERMLIADEDDEKKDVERKMKRYGTFFTHLYRLIEMMIHDVMNNFSSLPFNQPDANERILTKEAGTDSFEKLFNPGYAPEPFFMILRDHEYPLIGQDYNYLSRALKSGFCIWIYELQRQHVIVHQPDKVYAQLLLQKITGLRTFHFTLFCKTNNQAEERYRECFRKKIAEVKVLQDTPQPLSPTHYANSQRG